MESIGALRLAFEVEFNGAPESELLIFDRDAFPVMEVHMLGESTQALLFLAIVGLALVSTVDLLMQPVKQEIKNDKKH
jgi:hypothetical protein